MRSQCIVTFIRRLTRYLLVSHLLTCISDIDRWLSSNRLQLNQQKTEFIWLASPHHLANLQQNDLTVGMANITPSATVRDLGAYLDNTLSMNSHVLHIVQSCFFQLRQLK